MKPKMEDINAYESNKVIFTEQYTACINYRARLPYNNNTEQKKTKY